MENLLERFDKNNGANIDGRMPSTAECIAAVRDPNNADARVLRYLELWPELNDALRSILGRLQEWNQNGTSEQ